MHSRVFGAVLVLAVLVLAPLAFAQQDDGPAPEGQLLVDVMPQFVTTYRPESWVPVDILVRNNKRDISGSLTVTLYRAEEALSPVYHVPVESPKGSRKRFRVYCHLKNANSLSVMLYSGRRAALADEIKLTLRPIGSSDVLAMILDDEPSDYGFLFNAVQKVSDGLGYHRESLRTEELSQLPEYPQCYEPFTLVILGRIDPEAIPERQRELLRRYVEHGGVVAVCLGENAARYKGTWVESLAGVTIGDVEPSDELALAQRAFRPEWAAGARDGRSLVYTAITPSADTLVAGLGPESVTGGAIPVLATIRPVGSGHIATIAVDAAGKALQSSEGFTQIWRNLIALRQEQSDLHYDIAASQAENTLPSATGITVFPRSSVLIYLGLYFAVGIVGNWVFWSIMKRREMAWVCLVFISFGFTAYALVYGTAGRAKATEVAQIEVLHMAQESPTAKLKATVGLVSARSARYTITFPHAYALVSGVSAGPLRGAMGPSGLLGQINSFNFVQGPNPSISNFAVGASEMRVIQVESEIPAPGRMSGALIWDEAGIRGELANDTGLRLRSPFLFVDGRRYPLSVRDNFLIANATTTSERQTPTTQRNQFYGFYTNELMDIQSVREQYLDDLFRTDWTSSFLDGSLGPFVCAWVDGQPIGSVNIGEPANERIHATLLVADVRIDRQPGAGPRSVELVTTLPPQTNYGRYYSDNLALSEIALNSPLKVDISVPRYYRARGDGRLEIDVYWIADQQGDVLYLPEGAPLTWPGEHRTSTSVVNASGQSLNLATFSVENWTNLVDSTTGFVDGAVVLSAAEDRSYISARVAVRARLLIPQTNSYSGEWIAWQS